MEIEQTSGSGPNPNRVHFNAGTAKDSSGASFSQKLRAWYQSQSRFSKQSEIAAELGISLEAFGQWMAGRAFPTDPLCDNLFAITGLDCFSSAGRQAARHEHEAKRGLSRAAIAKREARQYITAKELAECRKDPEKAFTIRGDDWIVCLECGQLLKQIRGVGSAAHLREHSMSDEAYKVGPDPKNPRYGKNRPLVCNSLAKKQRESIAAKNLRPDAGRAYLRPQQKGVKMPPEHGRKQSARMRGHRNPTWSKNVADMEFVWPWLFENCDLAHVAERIAKLSADGKFSAGGVHARLDVIIGRPVDKKIPTAPSEAATFSAVAIVRRSIDNTALKIEIEQLCKQSRKESGTDRESRTVMLLLPKIKFWLASSAATSVRLSDADLARRFLADKAWVEPQRRRTKVAQPVADSGRPKGAAQRGRPKGTQDSSTPDKIRLAAELKVKGQSVNAMALLLYPPNQRRTERASQAATRLFLKRNRAAIESAKTAAQTP